MIALVGVRPYTGRLDEHPPRRPPPPPEACATRPAAPKPQLFLLSAYPPDRLACHRFVANAFRLFLHAVAYRLMHAFRAVVAIAAPVVAPVGEKPLRLATAQMDTLRLRLLKVAVIIVSSVRRVLVRLPRSFPLADAFFATARALGAG